MINPKLLGATSGYSNGILAPAGKLLFVAGQIGWDQKHRLADGLAAQFSRALRNVLNIVEEAGGAAEHITRLSIYITDKKQYLKSRKEIGKGYRQLMGKYFPAMSLLIVKDLLEEGALVEIEATAVIP